MDLQHLFAQKRLNNNSEQIELPQRFLENHPGLKRDKAEKLFDRYLAAVADVLIKRLPFLKDGECYVSLQQLMRRAGDFIHRGERFWVWNEFKQLYPFIEVREKGSNLRATDNGYEKNTRVLIVNERKLAMLLHERSPENVYKHHFTPEDELEITDGIEIDMDNLERFIGCTELELVEAEGENFRGKLQRGLWQAMIVQKIGQYTQATFGHAFLPLIPSKSPFGRTYYKGLNIQNVIKEVRSAIIGPHFQYDMNAAVFGIKLMLFGQVMGGDNNLVGTPHGSYTREYLADKNLIRNRLARECFAGVDLPWDKKVKNIKAALTAIGFGARTTGKTWPTENGQQGTALAEIITSAAARETFLADPWVKLFLNEQKGMEDAILAAYEQTGEAYEVMCQVVRDANGTNGKVSRAGKLAYLYQQWETQLMDDAVAVLAAHNIEPVARIHDAFITHEKLSGRVMDDIADAWGFRDYLSLDRDEIPAWSDPNVKRALREHDRAVEAHKQFIANEERRAPERQALKRLRAGAA